MASGSLGGVYFNSPVSLNCTMPANTYPNGSITFSNMSQGNAYWIQSSNCEPNVEHIWTLYVCDSAGNCAHSIGTVSVTGTSGWYSNGVFTSSFSVSGASDLSGKALYLKATCNKSGVTGGNFEHRGTSSVTINTAVSSVTCTVSSADTNKGTVSGGGSHTPGVAVNISASAKTGYHFTGWTCTSGSGSFGNASSASTTFTSSANSTVVASFAANNYTITVNGTANTWAYGSVHSISAPAKTGYTFSSWSATAGSFASATAATTNYTVAASNATVTANYSTNNYTITVNGSANSWAYGSTHTLNAPSAPTGKQFSSWSKSGSGSLSTTSSSTTVYTVGAGTATITTNYSWIYRTVSKASNPSAGGTVTLGTTSAHYGETVTVGATPATGYQLSSWSTNVSGVVVSNSKFTMPNSAITVTGNFSKVNYSITCNANPSGGGTPSASKNPANYGDSITMSHNRASGYLFDGWTSNDVTITDNAFTMPNKNITVTGHYHIGRSTASVDKTSVNPGDTITLTINADQSSFYHKYKLSFGFGMETELTTLEAGVSTAEIYIPLAWSRMMKSMQVTNGTLKVYTYESDDSLLGEYIIDSLTYNALNGIIPKLTIRRADDVETLNIKGEKARYTIAVPSGVDYTLTCDNVSVDNPPRTGLLMPENTMTFATNTSVPVELEIEYGDETFSIIESVPSIWLLSKSVG